MEMKRAEKLLGVQSIVTSVAGLTISPDTEEHVGVRPARQRRAQSLCDGHGIGQDGRDKLNQRTLGAGDVEVDHQCCKAEQVGRAQRGALWKTKG